MIKIISKIKSLLFLIALSYNITIATTTLTFAQYYSCEFGYQSLYGNAFPSPKDSPIQYDKIWKNTNKTFQTLENQGLQLAIFDTFQEKCQEYHQNFLTHAGLKTFQDQRSLYDTEQFASTKQEIQSLIYQAQINKNNIECDNITETDLINTIKNKQTTCDESLKQISKNKNDQSTTNTFFFRTNPTDHINYRNLKFIKFQEEQNYFRNTHNHTFLAENNKLVGFCILDKNQRNSCFMFNTNNADDKDKNLNLCTNEDTHDTESKSDDCFVKNSRLDFPYEQYRDVEIIKDYTIFTTTTSNKEKFFTPVDLNENNSQNNNEDKNKDEDENLENNSDEGRQEQEQERKRKQEQQKKQEEEQRQEQQKKQEQEQEERKQKRQRKQKQKEKQVHSNNQSFINNNVTQKRKQIEHESLFNNFTFGGTLKMSFANFTIGVGISSNLLKEASLSYKISPALELGTSYLKATASKNKEDIRIKQNLSSATISLKYSYQNKTQIIPYTRASIGYAVSDAEIYDSEAKSSTSGISYGIAAGFKFNFTDLMKFNVEYNIGKLHNKINITNFNNTDITIKPGILNNIMFGINIAF